MNIPFTKASSIYDDLGVVDGTRLLQLSLQHIFSDVEEEIPNVDGV